MPINLNDIPHRLQDAARNHTLVPLIGAGVSRQSVTATRGAFPTWSDFLSDLASAAKKQGELTPKETKEIKVLVARGKFLMAAQAVKSAISPDAFEHMIQERFAPADAKPAPIHRALFKLQPSVVLTTNYDRLLEDAYAAEFLKAPDTLTWKDAPQVQKYLQSGPSASDRPLIFKLHGSVSFPSETILAEQDYRQLLYREPGYRMVLSAIFLTRVVLMLGYSFADPELMALVETIRDALKYAASPDYIVLAKGRKGPVERKRLRHDFGLHVIEYEPSPGHPELTELVEYLASLRGTV